MKVCIHFGDIRCIVPVGDGSIAVKQVIDLAVDRYRKATSKPADAKITVHSLKTFDGAILDLDDILNHVADDREQLIALYDECINGNGGSDIINHNHRQQHYSPMKMKNGIYGKVNHANTARLHSHPTVDASQCNNVTHRLNVNPMMTIPNGNEHSISNHPHHHRFASVGVVHHHIPLNTRAEPIYGRTTMNGNNSYIYGYHHHPQPPLPPPPSQQQHQQQTTQHRRNDSVSDSLLSSNESPEVFDSPNTDQSYCDRINGSQPIRSLTKPYSYDKNVAKICSTNGFRNKLSMDSTTTTITTSTQCHNQQQQQQQPKSASSSARPISINNSHRRNDFLLSRSYDPTYADASATLMNVDGVNGVSVDDSCDVVEITADQINSYSNIPSLHVRHGSEPVLIGSPQPPPLTKTFESSVGSNGPNAGNMNGHQMNDSDDHHHQYNSHQHRNHYNQTQSLNTKRWSTAVVVDHTLQSQLLSTNNVSNALNGNTCYEHSDEEKSASPQSNKEEGYASEERPNSQMEPMPNQATSSPSMANSPLGKFTRGSGRHSILANNLDAWADAADRQLMRLKNERNSTKGINHHQGHGINTNQVYDSSLGSMTSTSSQENEHQTTTTTINDQSTWSQNLPKLEELTVIIDLAKESGPLGIHVLPDGNNGLILNRGLLIQGIEPGGRIDRDGRLHVGDTIVEIDGKKFTGLNFETAQDIFRSSLQNDRIHLSILKTSSTSICDSSLYASIDDQQQQSQEQHDTTIDNSPEKLHDTTDQEILVEGEARAGQQTRVATVTSTRKHSIGGGGSNTLPIPIKSTNPAIVVANTRRIGKKYHIQLKKGKDSLGFTITTRDNPAGGLSPIYIKTILPRGAAVEDGRLKPGDRLLEVCGIEMTGKTQAEAVKILRTLPMNSIVDLIVSRQEVEMSPSPLMPRQLPPEKVNDDESKCSSPNDREVMVFQIPLNDTGSAGLGVSVKGKTSAIDGKQTDLGIFVKSVIHGGAASKDGRLRQDDQLISINECALSGKTNSEAMETLRRVLIQPQFQSKHDGSNPAAITLTIARRACRSPSHHVDSSNEQSIYRHQHGASILSSDSFDLSFNGEMSPIKTGSPTTSPYNTSHNEDDSYRSSDNTVIYNGRAGMINQSSTQSPNDNAVHLSLNDSQLSLNDDGGERFKRDGFGRQSMSEKRHAQLDAKSTDTYRRNKKAKDDCLNNNDDDESEKDNSITDVNQSVQSGNRSRQPVTTVSYGEDEQNDRLDAIRRMNSASIKLNPDHSQQTGFNSESTSPPKSRSPTKNQMLMFSPCCIKCQSPGSCPHHSKSDLGQNIRNRNGLYVKNSNDPRSMMIPKEVVASPFGLRRSCSLESLQMMMQDLQKEQVEKVGGNIPGFTGTRHGTVRVARSRETNESFRVAVDRSYDIKKYMNCVSIGKVDEEYDSHEEEEQSTSRPSTCPYRVGGGHSMTTTTFTSGTALTTTTNEDDNANLLKPKKKKGLFRNLFHFGSKKGRSKSASSEPTQRNKHDDSTNSEDMFRSPDLNRKYQLQQEKINAQYRKLMEQKQQQQHHQQQQQQQHQSPQNASTFVRNQLHPMHQSMPVGHRSKTSPNMKNITEPMIGSPNGRNGSFHPGFMANSPHYGSNNVMQRDTVGVPQMTKNDKINSYTRQNHRVHPEMKMNESPMYNDSNNQIRRSDGPRHLRGNSHDFYGRSPMDRPGSRVAISENSNYATQGIYSTYGKTVSANGILLNGQMMTSIRDNPNIENIHHYRQLSLRNPQHHRQISSPATNQQYYGTNPRPVSSYIEYDQTVKANCKGQPNQGHYGQVASNYHSNNETMYGLVGQQHKRTLIGQHMSSSGSGGGQPNIIRQQQPIYQSNQVQIYGSVYQTAPNPNSNNHYNRIPSSGQIANNRSAIYGNFQHNHEIYGNANGLPNTYQTKG